jgi:hypothetical protein
MIDKPKRRQLVFHDLDEAVRDAESLLAMGYERAGNWDLAQLCSHLAEWVRYPMDGFPPAPWFVRPAFWLMRVTMGKGMGRRMVESGTMKAGLPTAPASVFPAGGDAGPAVETYRKTVERWKGHTGTLYPSPLFGAQPREQWDRMQLVHAAHHLSFLIPKQR